ncbi:hypothetical protein [Defluviimonas salinarum]|uniref:Uncharacterized protein n=1 Tax=Defluviimonas salinarum TaxID=2992147 RepID=A0ABT3J954_9RHOB|nr:hypothetical protein [Defluviimonas salinarum]MCW3784222.1 hypothetical protein [Defluviimonas salinarum]
MDIETITPGWVDAVDVEADDLVTPDLHESFASIAGLPKDDATKVALVGALDAFRSGYFDLDALRSESDDNKALEAAADSAGALYDALLALLEYPGVEGRLEQTIQDFPRFYEFEDGRTLKDLIGTRQNIFMVYRELLVDLQACLEMTSNRKPMRKVLEGLDGEEPIKLETDEGFSERMREWRARSKARALPRLQTH